MSEIKTLYERVDHIISQPASQRLIEIKLPRHGSAQFNLCGKRVLGAHPYRDGYILTPFSAGDEVEFIVDQGSFKKLGESYYSLYALDGDSVNARSFYFAPSKASEVLSNVIRSQGWGGMKNSGYIGRSQRILVNPCDFWEFTGKSHDEYTSLDGFWEWELDINKAACIARLKYYPRKRRGCGPLGVQPTQGSYFYLPTEFFVAAGKPLNQVLPTRVDYENKVITFESPVELCECCGKPLRNRNGNIKRVQACESCTFTLREVAEITKGYTSDSVEALTHAFNEISGNLQKYSSIVNELISFADSI